MHKLKMASMMNYMVQPSQEEEQAVTHSQSYVAVQVLCVMNVHVQVWVHPWLNQIPCKAQALIRVKVFLEGGWS